MALEKTRGQNYNLADLLDGIDDGSVALPEFQRDFDWSTNQVRQLIATVLLGWPLGSLLLLQASDDTFFRLREFEGAPKLGDTELVVLDGQQRLTALYHALRGTGPGQYYLDLNSLDSEQSIEALEEAIAWLPSVGINEDKSSPSSELSRGRLPITALSSAASFYDWRDAATEGSNSGWSRRLTDLYKSQLAGLHKYEVPATVIRPDVPGEAVARIFERVNRLGKPLGTFDLVVARSFTKNFNLRDEWDRARLDHPRLSAFLGDDGTAVLNVIALILEGNVRAQAVLELKASQVQENWHIAVRAVDSAVRFMEDRLGVWAPDWLPYKAVLTVLAGYAVSVNLSSDHARVERWFWTTGFGQAFDVASNTRAVAAFRALKSGEQDWGLVALDPESLIAANKKQYGAFHRSFLCFLAANGALNFDTDEPFAADEDGLPPRVGTLSAFTKDQSAHHLRTLGLFIVSRSDARKYASITLSAFSDDSVRSQLGPVDSAETPEVFLAARARQLVAALRTRGIEAILNPPRD